jgi:hypothetical protein
MSRPMFYPMGTYPPAKLSCQPAANRGDAKRISRNVSQYGIRNGKAFKCRTINGVTFIIRELG